jgi:CcmD family protein
MLKRLCVVCCTVMVLAGSAHAGQVTPPGQAPPNQGEFVPADTLPPADQLPAAPLLITAYAFVWVVIFFYVWTIWRRLNKVEAEMLTLEQRSRAR